MSGDPLQVTDGMLGMMQGVAPCLMALSPMMGPIGALCGLISGLITCYEPGKADPVAVVLSKMEQLIGEVRSDMEELNNTNIAAE